MKFSNRSILFKYLISIESVFLFAGIVSFVFSGFLAQEPSVLSQNGIRNHAVSNYRLLNHFFFHNPTRTPDDVNQSSETRGVIATIKNINQAIDFFSKKRYSAAIGVLRQIGNQTPFLTPLRNRYFLQSIYYLKRYQEFSDLYQANPVEDFAIQLQFINVLTRLNRNEEAFNLFKNLFAKKNWSSFRETINPERLNHFLSKLSPDFWIKKFSFLLDNGEQNEFLLEGRLCRSPQLVSLFQARLNIQQKKFDTVQTLLQQVQHPDLNEYKEDLLIRNALRQNPADVSWERIENIKRNWLLYNDLLFDSAGYLLNKGSLEKARFFFLKYLQATDKQEEKYWRSIWFAAWISYRKNQLVRTRKYLDWLYQSHLENYQIASYYWMSRLDNRWNGWLKQYPFSYYTIKVFQDRSDHTYGYWNFLNLLKGDHSLFFTQIIDDLKKLLDHNLISFALNMIEWAKEEPGFTPSDINILKIIQSILYLRQNNFYMAFSKFKENFSFYQSLCLPKFLSSISFPIAFYPLIQEYSRKYTVDPFLVLAVIRQETFFKTTSVSSAGAIGLMQLMPRTARREAEKYDMKVSERELFNPEINIILGISHLKQLLNKYQGKTYLALAAYNAGEDTLDQWLTDFGHYSEEEFIEMIPFTETRNYVKNIVRDRFFYYFYYGKN